MAGFNAFNERPGLEGNTAAQPRVFGHDVIATTPYWNFTISAGGTGYTNDSIGDTVTDATTGFEANITAVTGAAVTGLTIITKGSGIISGQELTLTGAVPGSGLKITILASSLSIATAESRGAMIYNNKTAAQDISIITEAGTAVTFKSVPATEYVGFTHPVLAIELTGGDDILAVY